jgi:hypothetical protein
MIITDFRENDAVEGFLELYRNNTVTAEELALGILRHAERKGESEEDRARRQSAALSPLVEALRKASASDVVVALAQLEAEGRQGFRYEVGIELYQSDPVKELPGPGPYASFDRPDHGYVVLTGYDPARRADAIKGIRRVLTTPTTMEALAMLKKLDAGPVEFEMYGKADAEEARSLWESFGFTVRVDGFGATRDAKTHTVRLRDWGRAAPA